MRFNSAQKAQQALEELTKEGALEDRLRSAYGHLILAGGVDYAQDSSEIIEAYRRASEAFDRGDIHAMGTGIREMIEAIFEEEGANQVRQQLDG